MTQAVRPIVSAMRRTHPQLLLSGHDVARIHQLVRSHPTARLCYDRMVQRGYVRGFAGTRRGFLLDGPRPSWRLTSATSPSRPAAVN